LILADVDDVVEDQEMIFVELGERTFEREVAAGDLQALDTRSLVWCAACFRMSI
jgi:hypothetical protein